MWRSFFLASGVFSILMGFQTLAVDQFNVVNFRRIPKMVASKALGYINSPGNSQTVGSGLPQVSTNGYSLPSGSYQPRQPLINQQPYSPYGASAYGPSRYQGTQSGSFNRFGSNQSSQYQQPQNPFQQRPSTSGQTGLAGYSQPIGLAPGAYAGAPPRQTGANNLAYPRIFKTQDWMPWSLMAVGTIIVLYTSRRRGDDE